MQQKRIGLLTQLDTTFSKKSADENVKAYGDFYDTTMALMKSTDLKAFDLAAEPAVAQHLTRADIDRPCSPEIHFAHADDTFRRLGLSPFLRLVGGKPTLRISD